MSKLDTLDINKSYPTHPSNFTSLNERSIYWIVVHYTGGVGTALANVRYYQSPGCGASAHYFVGQASENARIYQGVDPKDKAWHCGTDGAYYCDCRNGTSIGIEVACHNDTADKTAESPNWYFDAATVDRLAELVRALMEEYKIDAGHVVRHYDVTHKICPAMWVHDEAAWQAFKARLTGGADDAAPAGKETQMNIVTGSTASEKRLIKGIQAANGSVVDGEIGTQTMSDIACRLHADCFPLTLSIYGAPVIIAKDIVVAASPGTGLGAFTNSMNGGFYAGGAPCSICVRDGKTVQPNACHAYQGYPESVLYRQKNGNIGLARVKNVSELPHDLIWAVGGMGLLNSYDPAAEGFCRVTTGEDFSDVLRMTNHTMLGVKNGYIYMVYCADMTAGQVNAFAKTLGLEKAIMLDGGHIAGMNGTERFAQINTAITQYYMIQGV